MAPDLPAEIKTALQCRGVRLHERVGSEPVRVRLGGAGPAEGITLLLDGSPASVPFASPFVVDSPWVLRPEREEWILYRNGRPAGVRAALLPEISFYRKQTRDGVPLDKIALLHGSDCLASTVLQSCAYWGTPAGCGFCGIGLSLRAGSTILRKSPEDLAAAAVAARDDGVRHVTLTAGTTPGRQVEAALYLKAAGAIRAAAGLPVHVQLMPPVDRGALEKLRAAGVATVGIHLESFDPDVLRRVAPAKAALPLETFVAAWRDAVAVFGTGQVESFLLMGLGESAESLLQGCERLASLGVYPYLVPFRPIPGTALAAQKPPKPDLAVAIYRQAARILAEHGLDWANARAGCMRCRGCSSLPDFQEALVRGKPRASGAAGSGQPDIEWEVFRNGALLEAALAIRREVFVEEQGFSEEEERDVLDRGSVHVVARQGSRCLGTVRITALGEDLWLGSRLAVRPGFRGGIGSLLIRRAEEEVLGRGAKGFVAYIQRPRVGLFERLGWLPLEELPDYHGRPHTLMAAAGQLWRAASACRVSAEAVSRVLSHPTGR